MIRMLQGDDEAQWRALWTEYLDFDGSTLDSTIHDRTWTRLLKEDEPMHGALALAGGEAVGFVHYIFHPSTWSLGDSCYLQDLFVAPKARGKGYARALITHVCAEAATVGSSRVYWQTQADNATAIALYEKSPNARATSSFGSRFRAKLSPDATCNPGEAAGGLSQDRKLIGTFLATDFPSR